MNYSIEFSEIAINDLNDIFEYIAINLQSPQSAIKILSSIEAAISSLQIMPERYHMYDTKKWKERNLRVMPVDNYLVFYIPTHKDLKVTIIRILYSKRNIETIV